MTPHTIRRAPRTERTFTQAEVSEIVQKRLNRLRRDYADLIAAVLADDHDTAKRLASIDTESKGHR